MRRPSILVGLVEFDLLCAWRSCESALSRWQDRVMLALMLGLAALAAASAFERPQTIDVHPLWAALAAAFLAALVAAAHARRLESLACRSMVAPLALSRGARTVHLLALSAGLLALGLLVARAAGMVRLFSGPVLALILLSWAGGTLLGAGAARLRLRWRARPRPEFPAAAESAAVAAAHPQRQSSLLAIAVRGQLPFLSSRGAAAALLAALLIGFAQAAVACVWAGTLTVWAGRAVVAGLALVSLLSLSRVPAGVCRFGIFAGVPTGHALAAQLAAPALATAGAVAAALPFYRADPAWTWLQLGCGLAATLAAAARVLHYRLFDKSKADRLMQFQLAALALAAGMIPPAMPFLVAVRIATLHRGNRKAAWAVS